ncbi:MAG: NAD(P)-dependent oxidoreductase [bacterium]|nr:NAD(P)-dependent oxidoreductase [bacterium]
MNKPILLIWLTLREVDEFTATEAQVQRWTQEVPELEVIYAKTQEEFIRNLSKATYIFCFKFSEAWLGLTYRAKWIATPGAGKELLGPIPERLNPTFGTFHGDIMAETVVGMLLAIRRGLLPGLGLGDAKDPWPVHLPRRTTIAGSHAVILGYGNIGQCIGQKLSALGVQVTGIRRANFNQLDELLPTADALILALPQTPETDHLLNATRIAKLSKQSVVINVGRGNAIDEKALCKALKEGQLWAAFLDVMHEEPYPGGLLTETPRCYILPHASAFAPDYLDRAFDEWLHIYRTTYATPNNP